MNCSKRNSLLMNKKLKKKTFLKDSKMISLFLSFERNNQNRILFHATILLFQINFSHYFFKHISLCYNFIFTFNTCRLLSPYHWIIIYPIIPCFFFFDFPSVTLQFPQFLVIRETIDAIMSVMLSI